MLVLGGRFDTYLRTMSTEIPPAYDLDLRGRRVLKGLSYDETCEFERLDASLPYAGKVVWLDGLAPLSSTERRWLELWSKHRTLSDQATRGDGEFPSRLRKAPRAGM